MEVDRRGTCEEPSGEARQGGSGGGSPPKAALGALLAESMDMVVSNGGILI